MERRERIAQIGDTSQSSCCAKPVSIAPTGEAMGRSRFGVVGTFLFAVAITALLLHLWQSQLIAPSGAANTAFSEEHAFATLSALLKEQRPHTAGSPENAV